MSQDMDSSESPFRYVHSDSVVSILGGLGASLLVSTYQAGKLAVIRTLNGRLRMLPRTFDKAMGIAVDRQRMAVATDWQIWTLGNSPQIAAKMGVEFDACYLPRTSHVTGSIDVHEIAWAKSPEGGSDDLWVVNTLFCCLCTLDAQYSFVPRWRPPFVSKITRQDRCHLNGLAIVDGRPKYVTVFGETNTPEGWRPNKAEGGCLIDVESGQTVVHGLSMPHSPRWYDGRLWLLDSGRGRLCTVDLAKGSIQTVAELSGYTRGLAFCDRYAFVGLSKVRETAVFGGVPISEQNKRRRCGVSIVNIDSGQIVAFLEFEGRVEEIFDVQILAGVRFPTVIGFKKETIQRACVIAPEQPAPGLSPPRHSTETGSFGSIRVDSTKTDADDPALVPARDHNNRGLAQLQQGLLQEAATSFREAVAIAPNYAKAHGNLGNVLTELGELTEAVASCRRALKIDPGNTIAHNNLGNALRNQGHLQDAVASYRNALAIDGNYALAHYNIGTTLVELEQPDPAIKYFQRSLKAKADFVEAHISLGSLLQNLNRLEEAESSFREAVRLNPDQSGPHVNMGNVLRGQGRLDAAESELRKALALKPDSLQAHNDLGMTLRDGLKLKEAINHFKQAVAVDPEFAVAHMNLGLALLLTGDLEAGWAEYEWRLAIDKGNASIDPNRPSSAVRLDQVWPGGIEIHIRRRNFPQPYWNGASLKNRTILVWGEQGIGDEFMFAGLIPELIHAAGHCVIDCDHRSVPLFARSFPLAEIVGKSDPPHDRTLDNDIDVQSALGSLCRWLRPNIENFKPAEPYLKAHAEHQQRLRRRYKSKSKQSVIGISWRSGNPSYGKLRTAPLDLWDPILNRQNCTFVNLQYGDSRNELDEVRSRLGIEVIQDEQIDPLKDLDAFAAQVAAMDLVISIDNSTIHLAGALGRPVWTLLPYCPDWRWMLDRDDTPWYPTMRLFRQIDRGQWQDVFERVAEELKNWP